MNIVQSQTFTTEDIDASFRMLLDGGDGSCTQILSDTNKLPLQWVKHDTEDPTVILATHRVAVMLAAGERVDYVICRATGSFTLSLQCFSGVCNEAEVHRVFCAALAPTNASFTFSNPIKNITVPASADTVTVKVDALTEYKTIKSTDTVTITNTQTFPCVFGVIYKPKPKGEISGGVSPTPPEPTEKPVHRYLISFSAHDEINYCQKMFDAGEDGIKIEKVTLNTLEDDIQCQRLVFRRIDGSDYDIVDSDDGLIIGDNDTLSFLLNGTGFLGEINGKISCELTVPECPHDVVLTIYYTEIESDD